MGNLHYGRLPTTALPKYSIDAYLHSRGISGVGSWKNDGTLYLEDNAASVTGQNTFSIAGNFY